MDPLFQDERISAYLDGELPPDERARFEDELARNGELRQVVEELRGLHDSLQELPRHRLNDDFAQHVLRRAERTILSDSGAVAGGADDSGAEDSHLVRTGSDPSIPETRRSRRPWIWAAIAVAAAIALLVFNPRKQPVQIAQREAARTSRPLEQDKFARSLPVGQLSAPADRPVPIPPASVEANSVAARRISGAAADAKKVVESSSGPENGIPAMTGLTLGGGTLSMAGAGSVHGNFPAGAMIVAEYATTAEVSSGAIERLLDKRGITLNESPAANLALLGAVRSAAAGSAFADDVAAGPAPAAARSGVSTYGGGTSVNGGGLTFNGGTSSFGGIIAGGASAGHAVAPTVTDANAYTGGTITNGGTLTLQPGRTITNGGTLTLQPGGTANDGSAIVGSTSGAVVPAGPAVAPTVSGANNSGGLTLGGGTLTYQGGRALPLAADQGKALGGAGKKADSDHSPQTPAADAERLEVVYVVGTREQVMGLFDDLRARPAQFRTLAVSVVKPRATDGREADAKGGEVRLSLDESSGKVAAARSSGSQQLADDGIKKSLATPAAPAAAAPPATANSATADSAAATDSEPINEPTERSSGSGWAARMMSLPPETENVLRQALTERQNQPAERDRRLDLQKSQVATRAYSTPDHYKSAEIAKDKDIVQLKENVGKRDGASSLAGGAAGDQVQAVLVFRLAPGRASPAAAAPPAASGKAAK